MAKKEDWNIEGQISIFDLMNENLAAEPDFESMTIEEAAEIIQKQTGLIFTKCEEHFVGNYKAKKKGYVINIHFTNFDKEVFGGARFIDLQIDKDKWGMGRPCTSIDEAVKSILANINKCEHSGHTCNKKELWEIAESLDNMFCPHVCCRFCSTECCGARCNGSEEPKKTLKNPEKPEMAAEQPNDEGWHNIEEEPNEGAFCLFEYLWSRNSKDDSKGHCTGWWESGKVKWLNMPWDIGKKRVIKWKPAEEPQETAEEPEMEAECETCLYDKKGCCGFNTKDEWCVLGNKWQAKEPLSIEKETICTKAKECEAYPSGCGGTIEPCTFGGPYKWSDMPEPQPREVDVKGIMDDGYCPECNACLDDLIKECPYCGQLLSWEHWKRMNDYTEE